MGSKPIGGQKFISINASEIKPIDAVIFNEGGGRLFHRDGNRDGEQGQNQPTLLYTRLF